MQLINLVIPLITRVQIVSKFMVAHLFGHGHELVLGRFSQPPRQLSKKRIVFFVIRHVLMLTGGLTKRGLWWLAHDRARQRRRRRRGDARAGYARLNRPSEIIDQRCFGDPSTATVHAHWHVAQCLREACASSTTRSLPPSAACNPTPKLRSSAMATRSRLFVNEITSSLKPKVPRYTNVTRGFPLR